MDTTGNHAPKGDVDVEGGISHQSTAKESLPPGQPPALPQTCMERPYNATTEEVMAYYQVRKKKRGGEGERMVRRWCIIDVCLLHVKLAARARQGGPFSPVPLSSHPSPLRPPPRAASLVWKWKSAGSSLVAML
jgi:hypothetical protein